MEEKWLAIMVMGIAFSGALAITGYNAFHKPSIEEQRASAYKSCMSTIGSNEQTCKELAFGKSNNY